MKKVICFLIISVAGCHDMNAVMKSWEGSHISEVIAQWGPPNSQQEIAGGTMYRWVNRDFMYMPRYSTITSHADSYGSLSGSTYSTDSYDLESSCIRILKVNNAGYVIGGRWEGGKCNNMNWMKKNEVKTNKERTTYSYVLPDSNTSLKKLEPSLDLEPLAREQELNNIEQSGPNAPMRKIRGYQAGINSKTGEIKTHPVYEEQNLPDSGKLAEKPHESLDAAQLAHEQEPNDIEQSEPNAPIRKIRGYQAGIDPNTGEIKTYPVYEDEQKK